MRKFTLFLTLMVAMVTTTMAQTAITSLEQLSNSAIYTIKPANYASSGVLCSNPSDLSQLYITAFSGATVDANDANQQFAILSDNGKYFLYNVGAGKFVAKNGNFTSLTDDVTASNEFKFEASNTTPDNGHTYVQADYPWCLVFDGVTLCASNASHWAAHGGALLNWDSNGDSGCVYQIVTVDEADVDLAEALAAVKVYTNKKTVTYKYTYAGQSLGTETFKGIEAGSDYPAPTDLPFGYVLDKTPEGAVEDNCEIDVELAPAYAESVDKIEHWFYVQLHSNNKRYVQYVEGADYIEWADATITEGEEDAYTWAFVGTPATGFKLINRAAGTDKAVYSDGSSAPAFTDFENATLWIPAASKETSKNGYFCLQYPSGNYMNAQGNKIAFWNNNDAGSTLLLTEREIAIVEPEVKFEVTAQEPAADEVVESLSSITIEFSKDIELVIPDAGTGTNGTGTNGTGTNGTGTNGTGTGTDGTGTSAVTYIKLKDANNGNVTTAWLNAAKVEGNKVTFTFESNTVVTKTGTYTFEIPAGVIKSKDGEEFAGQTFTFQVEEPAIFPAEGGIVAGEAAFVAEGASYDGEEYATISGEIVSKEYSTANVKVAHTKKSSSNSKVQSGLVRWYKYDILTFTPMNNAKLTKIVFTGTTGDYQSELTASAGTVTLDETAKTITWTGEATEALTLAADNSQVRFASAIVTYEINTGSSSVAAPVANVKADTYYNAFDLELTAAEGAKIYYVTDDSELSSKANVYEGAIKVGYGETTIKAFAVADGVASPAVTLSYNVAVAAPKFSVEPGVYESIEGFEMTTESEGATIIYIQNNTTGKDVKNSNFVFSKPVNIMATREYEAIAYVVVNENDTIWSDITKAKYYISWKTPYKAVKEITTGAKYVIEYNNAVIAPVAEKSDYGNPVTAEAAIANGYAEALAHYAYTITAVENEDETAPVVYTIQDTFGRYLYGKDGYSSINVSDEKPETGADWEIAINAETGKATVKNVLLGTYLSYYYSKKSFNLYSSAAEVTLYEETEYPNFTTTPSGGYGEEIESIKVVTISCESGLALVEEAPAVVMTVRDSEWNETEYTAAVAMTEDGNITLTFEQEFTENGNYSINIPAGLFRMDPNGLNSLNEGRWVNLEIYKAIPLEIVDVTPVEGIVEQIEIIKIKFNQLVQPFIMNSLTLACADGDDVELQLVYELYDEETQEWIYPAETEVWVAQIDENGQIAPITAKGTYTLDLEDITFYVNNAPALVEGTYTWTIAVTTGIEGVDAENGEQVIYDLTGRRIKEINNAGIYVVNGKKVIVK